MQLLDERDIAGYADTFTEDAEFAHTPGQAPSRTRPGIVEDLTEFHRRFADDPMQRRHCVSMINLKGPMAAHWLHGLLLGGEGPAQAGACLRELCHA